MTKFEMMTQRINHQYQIRIVFKEEYGDLCAGETKRPLQIRIKEHKTGVANRIQWERTQIIWKETHWYKREFKEVAHMAARHK